MSRRSRRSTGPKMPERNSKLLNREKKLIDDFIAHSEMPGWWRGKSWYQIGAANQLQNAIRDDAQQGSIFRTREILVKIGVKPMISDRKLKKVMQWSYGNDLAFLWFLMEAYYKTPGKSYSVNEQLLLSSIAHLDMVTTLRALDHVLPPGNPSRKNLAKEERRREKQRQHAIDVKKRMPKKSDHPLPYMHELPRMYPEHKSFRSAKPDIQVGTNMYEIYKDPSYEVRNEATRWYATYKLNTAYRLATTLIRDELEMLFGNKNELAQRDLAGELIESQLKHIFNPQRGIMDEPNDVVCTTHRNERDCVKEHRKVVEKRDRCLELLNKGDKKKKARIKGLLDKLDKDVTKYQSEYHKQVPRKHKGNKIDLLLLHKDEVRECQVGEAEAGSCLKSPSFECVPASQKEQKAEEEGKEKEADDNIKGSQSSRLLGGEELDDFFFERYHSHILKILKSIPHLEQTPPSSNVYFEAPTKHQPFHFNYHKIFTLRNKDDINRNIREECVKALDGDLKTAKLLHEVVPDLQHTATQCADKIWTNCVEDWNDNKRTSSFDSDRNAACPKAKTTDGIPQLDYYDCEDKNLMSTMLKEALRIISKDTRFVLASMEGAYKLPILREWIYRRYGKTYTAEECKKIGELSVRILKGLDCMKITVPVPRAEVIGSNLHIKYTCKDYAMKKADYHKKKFYRRLNDRVMDITRNYWFGMFPRMVVHTPPKSMFFAYMPSREMDFYHFRPWLRSEYMDAKAAWDNRREKQKQKLLA